MKRPNPSTLRWVATLLRRVARQMDDYNINQGAEGLRETAAWLDQEAGQESEPCQTEALLS